MDIKTKKQLVNDYRKAKKINKSKKRDGKNMKDFRNNDDSILNSLPSGLFDNNESKKKLFKKDNDEKEDNDKKEDNDEKEDNDKKEDNDEKKDDFITDLDELLVDEEEYEEFNDDYFNQEVVK